MFASIITPEVVCEIERRLLLLAAPTDADCQEIAADLGLRGPQPARAILALQGRSWKPAPWTPREDAILRRLRKRRAKVAEYREKLPGRTLSAIAGRARRLKCPNLPRGPHKGA